MLKKIFYLDSHQRASGTHSDFFYNIDMKSVISKQNVNVVVLSAVVPRSYYLVTAANNTFQLLETGFTAVTITITPGSYSASVFRTTLKTLFDAATQAGNVYTITYSSVTGKFSYTNTGVVASLIIPAATNNGSGIHEQLGFNATTTVAFPITSINVVKFVAQDALMIRSDICVDKSGVLQDIVTAGSVDFASLSYRCPEIRAYAKPLNTKDSGTFRFTITDPDGNIIDTSGLPVYISLMIYRDPLDNLSVAAAEMLRSLS